MAPRQRNPFAGRRRQPRRGRETPVKARNSGRDTARDEEVHSALQRTDRSRATAAPRQALASQQAGPGRTPEGATTSPSAGGRAAPEDGEGEVHEAGRLLDRVGPGDLPPPPALPNERGPPPPPPPLAS